MNNVCSHSSSGARLSVVYPTEIKQFNSVLLFRDGIAMKKWWLTNLNNISKLLERLFLARLQPHLINSPHYNPLQSAYRTGHSTETALLTLLNKARLSADRGESTLLVSLDLSAAFDTIDHSILLARLRSMYGVDGNAFMWLESYLSQRVQYVKFGQDVSSSKTHYFRSPPT